MKTPFVDRKHVALVAALALIGAAIWWWSTESSLRSADLLHVSLQHTPADSPPKAERQLLRIAVAAMISPENTYHLYEKLLNRVGGLFGRPVQFVQRKSYREVNDLIEQRAVDLAFVCSAPYVMGHQRFGMELLAAPVKHGKKVYHAYIIVDQQSPLQSFEELRGTTFAFTDPDSNTGCLVPKYILAGQGEDARTFFGETFYSHGHDNSIKAVMDGTAAGAAVDSLIYDFSATLDPTIRSRTRIVLTSPPYGMPPIVVHPSMPAGEKDQLRRLFLGLHQDPVARPLLQQLQIDRFEEVDDSLYDSVRAMERKMSGPR
jgi:phosphonate transport system substrate-binding protein